MTKPVNNPLLIDNRYKVISKLGQGGFGQTYIANDINRPGKPKCVIKKLDIDALIQNHTDQAEIEEIKHNAQIWFNREAEVLEKLGNHEQIPTLLGYFSQDQHFYLVMEFVEGKLLSSEMDELIESIDREFYVIQILQDLLPVLCFIHQQGFIHRDIKPSNLIRRKDGKIILIDFGAVKEIKQKSSDTQNKENISTISLGSYGYTPDEQANQQPRPSSDIYALGMTCIQILTSIHPKDIPKDIRTGELIWRNFVPKISNQLANILDKMIRPHYLMRYQNSSEVIQALESIRNMPVPLAPTLPISPPKLQLSKLNPTVLIQKSKALISTILVIPKYKQLTRQAQNVITSNSKLLNSKTGYSNSRSAIYRVLTFGIGVAFFSALTIGLNIWNNNQKSYNKSSELTLIAPNFKLALSKSKTWLELAEKWLESGSQFKYLTATNKNDINALSLKFQEVEIAAKLPIEAVKASPANQVIFLTALAPKLKDDSRFIKMHEAIASIKLKPNNSEPANYNLGILIFIFTFSTIVYIAFIYRRYLLTIITNKIKTLQGYSQNLSTELDKSIALDSLETPNWLQEWETESFDSGFHPEARIPTLLDREIPQDVQARAIEAVNKVLYALKVSDQKSVFLCDVISPYLSSNTQNIAYFYYDLFCQLNEKIDVYDSQKFIKKKLVGVGLSSLLLKVEFIEFEVNSSQFKHSTTEINLSPFNLDLETQLLQISSWLIFSSQEISSFSTIKVSLVTNSQNAKSDRKLCQKITNLKILLKEIVDSNYLDSQIQKAQEFYRINILHTSQDELIQSLIQKSRQLASTNCENWHAQNQNQSSYARQPLEYLNLYGNSFDAFRYEMMKTKNPKLSLEDPCSTLMSYREFFAPQAFYQILMNTKFD